MSRKQSLLVIDTQELMDFIYNNDSINEKEALEKFIDSHRKQLPSKEHLTSVLENGDLFIKNHTLQDIINTIYSNSK